MKKNNFVTLCLRLLGIFFGVQGLSSLPHVTSMFIESSSSYPYLLVSPFILIACGLLLYIFAPRMSTFIIEFSEAEEGSMHITASEKTTRIALLVLGIFIFSQAIPQFIQLSIDIGLYYKTINEVPVHVRGVEHRWTYLIGPIIKLIIGTILIIGPDKVIGFLGKYDETFKKIESSNQEAQKGQPGQSDFEQPGGNEH